MPAENEFRVRIVRDVGPRKNMLCVSFCLPVEVEGVEKLVIENNAKDGDAGTCGEKRVRQEEEEGAAANGGLESNACKRSKET